MSTKRKTGTDPIGAMVEQYKADKQIPDGPSVTKPKRFKFKPDRNIDETSGFTNGERAERGEKSVRVHPDFDSNDTETAVVDALTDIFHFCDREGVDLELALKIAKGNWEEER